MTRVTSTASNSARPHASRLPQQEPRHYCQRLPTTARQPPRLLPPTPPRGWQWQSMTGRQHEPAVLSVQPVAVPKPTAAAMLGVSIDSFERHIQPDLQVIRRGRLRLFAVATRALGGRRRRARFGRRMTPVTTCLTCGQKIPRGESHCKAHKRRGSTRQWRSLRQQILARDRYTCQICGAAAEHVDHKRPTDRRRLQPTRKPPSHLRGMQPAQGGPADR